MNVVVSCMAYQLYIFFNITSYIKLFMYFLVSILLDHSRNLEMNYGNQLSKYHTQVNEISSLFFQNHNNTIGYFLLKSVIVQVLELRKCTPVTYHATIK